MEHPAGFEPTVSELQSLALPLGYGCAKRIITAKAPKGKAELGLLGLFPPFEAETLLTRLPDQVPGKGQGGDSDF